MKYIEGILRRENINLYSFSDIAVTEETEDPEIVCTENHNGIYRIFVATTQSYDEIFLSSYGGNSEGVYDEIILFGMGMRGSSDIMRRALGIINDNKIRFRLSSMSERAISFLTDPQESEKLFRLFSEKFEISI